MRMILTSAEIKDILAKHVDAAHNVLLESVVLAVDDTDMQYGTYFALELEMKSKPVGSEYLATVIPIKE